MRRYTHIEQVDDLITHSRVTLFYHGVVLSIFMEVQSGDDAKGGHVFK